MSETSRDSVRDETFERLLGAGDPIGVECVNPDGRAGLVLICEHAGRTIPAALGDLGLNPTDMGTHIAYDIGAEDVARHMAQRLDAPLLLQRYSRLVIDPNRPFHAPDCIPEISDGVLVPGNQGLSEAARRCRQEEIHAPFHAAISDLLDARAAAARPTLLVTVHSFTPVLAGARREMEVGLLFNRDSRLALALKERLAELAPRATVALNAPYAVDDESDYAIPVHGEGRGLPHVLIELRNDLIANAQGQAHWAEWLADALNPILESPEFST